MRIREIKSTERMRLQNATQAIFIARRFVGTVNTIAYGNEVNCIGNYRNQTQKLHETIRFYIRP